MPMTPGTRSARAARGDGSKDACCSGWVATAKKSCGTIAKMIRSCAASIPDPIAALRTLPRPIYTISSDGSFGLSVDFRRIDNLRPGYGYDGLADPNVANRAPDDSGIWRVDLQTGEDKLILSLAEVAAIPWPDGSRHDEAWHYFNHLLINPSGTRFIVLHRYRPKFDPRHLTFEGNFVTRMFTANVDGSDRYVLDPSGYTSHFIWKGDDEVTMWTKPEGEKAGFYKFTDKTRMVVPVGQDKMPTNGHNTYLPAPL